VKNVDAPASKKLSKEQWAMARVYSFLDGNPSHDEDLRKNVGGSSRTHQQAFGDDEDEDEEDEDDFDDREDMLYEQEQEEMRRMVFNDAVEGYREEIEQNGLPFDEFAQVAETGYLTALQVDPNLTDQEIEDVVQQVYNQFMTHHVQRRNRTPAIGGNRVRIDDLRPKK
jgi:hypothetical protein